MRAYLAPSPAGAAAALASSPRLRHTPRNHPAARPARCGAPGGRGHAGERGHRLLARAEYSPEAALVTPAVPEGRETEAIDAIDGRPGIEYAELKPARAACLRPERPRVLAAVDSAHDRPRRRVDPPAREGVTIAVLDTGVAFEDYWDYARSPDLQNTSFVHPTTPRPERSTNDLNGHGTHVTARWRRTRTAVALRRLRCGDHAQRSALHTAAPPTTWRRASVGPSITARHHQHEPGRARRRHR
jgi:hypothetical protein